MIGKVLDKRYELVEQIGQGGMALVYRAIDQRTGHSVAVKILRPEYNQDAEYFSRFQREATAVSKMNHHNIVNLLDVGQEDNMRYLVMEYVRGRTLKDVIRQKGPLSPTVTAQIALRILSALQHAHKNGIIHRDIKPQNILVHADGHIKVTDFGIARVVGASTIGPKDSVMGSAQYLSPEQAQGQTVGFSSDLYSVGVVMYEMLTGQPPFQGENHVAVAMQHIKAKPRPIQEIKPETPAALVHVVEKAMEKRPENRYQSAVEMAQDLQLAMKDPSGRWIVHSTDQPITSLVQTGRQQTMNGAGKNWGWFLLILLVAFVLGGLVYGGYMIYDQVFHTTEAPYCLNETEADAERIITKAGLKIPKGNVTRETDDTVPAGQVIRQTPEYGVSMRRGDAMSLVISTGPDEKKIPNVAGMSKEEASKELETMGFTLLAEPERVLDSEPWDTVLSQLPQAGTPLKTGSVVRVTLSGGCVTLPDLVGKTWEEALKIIQDLNLELVQPVIVTPVEDEARVGRVCTQQYRNASYQEFFVGDQVMQRTQVVLGVYVAPEQQNLTDTIQNALGQEEEAQ